MIDKYLDRFANLRPNSNRGKWPTATLNQAPHKPLLLLAVLDLFAQEPPDTNLIKISPDLDKLFSSYWRLVMPTEKHASSSYSLPFFHLSTEKESFWHLVPRPGKEDLLAEAYRVAKMADSIRFSLSNLGGLILGARLDDDLHQLLRRAEDREKLRKVLIDTYFDQGVRPALYKRAEYNLTAFQNKRSFLEEDRLGETNGQESRPTRASHQLKRRQGTLRGAPLRELINVNTQVRRLAYFPALLQFAARQNISGGLLAARLESWGNKHQEDLEFYLNSTGNVVAQHKVRRPRLPMDRASHAAKRYVDFAHHIGWLTQITEVYMISRTGRVMLTVSEELSKRVNQDEHNVFTLSEAQRLFFASELWRKDGDVLFTLLGQLDSFPVPLKGIQEDYSEAYREHLLRKTRRTADEHEYRQLLKRIGDIKTWTNPARYAEQFVATRLNWMLDLGLVSISSSVRRECVLTPAGVEYKNSIPRLHALSNDWLNAFFFKTVARFFVSAEHRLVPWDGGRSHRELLIQWLRVAFRALRHGPVPKFSLSQVSLFACVAMAVGSGVCMDRDDFTSLMAAPLPFNNDNVVEMRRSARENEAYLILNPR